MTKVYRLKKMLLRIKNSGGRSYGKITAPRRGDFSRHFYRSIDFKRTNLMGINGTILRKQYDALRSAPLLLVCYPLGILTYILSVKSLNVGDMVKNVDIENVKTIGFSTNLSNIRPGRIIHNIGLKANHIGQIVRSAGASSLIVKQSNLISMIKLKSGEIRHFMSNCVATLGVVDGSEHFLRDWRKAGTSRRFGFRPRVRPYAMNPVDHPMGGRTKGGIQPQSRKGFLAKHSPTVIHLNSFILFKRKRQNKISTL